MLIYRCYTILLDRKLKHFVSALASVVVIAVCVLITLVAFAHVKMFAHFKVMDIKSILESIDYMINLNVAQIILYVTVTISCTGIIFHYIGRCLMNNQGYYEYLRSSKSSRLAIIFIMDQLANLIWTSLVSTSAFQMNRSYFHYQNFSLALAAYFFYWTFEDIKGAVQQTGISSKSAPNLQSKSNNHEEGESETTKQTGMISLNKI